MVTIDGISHLYVSTVRINLEVTVSIAQTKCIVLGGACLGIPCTELSVGDTIHGLDAQAGVA